jgi:ATP-binding cassette subfamily D (ALD) protein 3
MSIVWYLFSGVILRKISPSFGKLTAIEQQLEGEYRAIHTALLAHSEEVAFYNGADWEQKNIDKGFKRLHDHIDNLIVKKFWMGIFDSMLVKYGATLVGYTVVGLPVFGPGAAAYLAKRGNQAQITKDYVRNSSLLINLAKAIGRIVVSYKEVQALAGYTTLVNQMDDCLKDLGNQKYRRVAVSRDDAKAKLSNANEEKVMSTRGDAKITQSSFIELVDVPILSPNNDMLIDKISFKVEPGQHLMITGPNGCGKSALFRIIGELWPCVSGSLSKPAVEDIFYIPQRAYLPTGSLRD